MKASDLMLKCLEKQGVKSIYGVPGEENADMMISLLESPIEFVSTRHEQTAAFMAEAHGRLTGNPGVCLATLGPGATNLLTGVAQADMDNSPLVAIIGQASTHRLHKESHQNMCSVAMFKSVTKWATTIRNADVIPEVIAKAFKIAKDGKPGAVLIELPEDIAKLDTIAKPIDQIQISMCKGTTDAHIEDALRMLAESKKPLLLAGDGATRTHCDAELKAFLDHTQLYCAHTFMGKGAISDRYARSLHTVGMGMKDISVTAFDEADLVICVGYDMVEWHPDRWNQHQAKRIIHINSTSAEVDKKYIPDIEMVGNIKIILQQINQHLNAEHVKADPYFESVRERAVADLHSYDNDDGFPMKPMRVLHDIRQIMRDEDILISDVGAHKMWVARQYETYQSNTCLISNGFCSMSGSLPGALEGKRLFPDRHVVALCGDGGFMMGIQALVTGAQLKVPFCAVLWEDAHYGLIKWKQEMTFNKHSHVNLENPDFVKLVEAFGGHAERVGAAADFIPAFERALAVTDRPAVVIVPIDYRENMKLFHHLDEVVEK